MNDPASHGGPMGWSPPPPAVAATGVAETSAPPRRADAAGTARPSGPRRDVEGSRLWAGRYRVSVGEDGQRPRLVPGDDELLGRPVTLILVPGRASMDERLRVRQQLRRLAEVRHEHLAAAFDVADSADGYAVVLPLLPGARLLSSALRHPDPGTTVEALHVALSDAGVALAVLAGEGLHHGAVSLDAVAITQSGRGVLLPVPGDPAGSAQQDQQDMEATRRLLPPRAAASLTTTFVHELAKTRQAAPAGRRWLLVLAGGLGGALLADLAQRLAG